MHAFDTPGLVVNDVNAQWRGTAPTFGKRDMGGRGRTPDARNLDGQLGQWRRPLAYHELAGEMLAAQEVAVVFRSLIAAGVRGT